MGAAVMREVARIVRVTTLSSVALLWGTSCDKMPPPTTQSAAPVAPLASAVPRPSSPPAATATLASEFLAAADAYTGRCVITHGFVFEASDLCTRIEHCNPGAKMNMDAPCGFTEAERAAVVDLEKRLGEAHLELLRLGQPELGAFTTYLRHAELFARWVRETTDLGDCLKETEFGAFACYEQTRGTVAMFQELALAYKKWRPEEPVLVVPGVHSCFEGAPPYSQYPAETRKKGLRWGRCPNGICLVVDNQNSGYGGDNW